MKSPWVHSQGRLRNQLRWILAAASAGIVFCALSAQAADAKYRVIADTYPEHTRAVELGRAGRHEAALRILQRLLGAFPDDYPLQRDFVMITAWKGDCDAALQRFERIRRHPNLHNYVVPAIQDCAVKRARAEDYDGALRVLEPLLAQRPADHPLRRDVAVIHAWKGDCSAALRHFEAIRGHRDHPPYLVVPVADCLLEANRPREASALVEEALARYPDDEDLQHARVKLEVALRVDEGEDQTRPEALFRLENDNSDQGLSEWRAEAEASNRLAPRTRLYARFLVSRASDPQYDAADMNRAGIGVRHRFDPQWRIRQEFSGDTQDDSLGGSTTQLTFEPRDTWRFDLSYTTYAEDIPLRARANDIQASGTAFNAEYSSTDHVWYWRGNLESQEFSDRNDRESAFTTVGYAYSVKPRIEQRVYLEAYQSSNTRRDAPYFNPIEDNSLGVVHRTDFHRVSNYLRHDDVIYLSVANYRQQGFGTDLKWGVKYEQIFDFDQNRHLSWAAGYQSNVYDGDREVEVKVELLYRHRF
jgi:tetratricopeptide (TPR) repeat protein